MFEPYLVNPSEIYRDSFLRVLDDYEETYGTVSTGKYGRSLEGFSDYLRDLVDATAKWKSEGGCGPASHYWLVAQSEIVGIARLHHTLSEKKGKLDGHISYNVPPSQRREGYGTLLLKRVLERARQHGLRKVLVTCDEDNLPSKKIIERNGGQFEDKMLHPETGTFKLRYWIET